MNSPLRLVVSRMSALCPDNLEHRQARTEQMHTLFVQALDVGDFPAQVVTSFPGLPAKSHRLTEAQMLEWWGDYADWYLSLPADILSQLNRQRVLSEV